MATYKGIQGYSVQKLSSDPTVEDTVGQLWYNSTAGKFKIGTEGAGAWASGGNLNTAKRSMMGTGTTAAMVVAGGISGAAPPHTTGTDVTETYNGSAWSTSPATLNTSRNYNIGDGITTAAITTGGVLGSVPGAVTGATETFDGSAWTTVNSLITDRSQCGHTTLGSITASLVFGGGTPTIVDITEIWDGTSWAERNDLNTARQNLGGAGTTTAALAFGGMAPPESTLTEIWDGTSWSVTNVLNSKKENAGATGTSISALYWGGNPDSPGILTEKWNGTSWTEVGDLANKTIGPGSGGVSNTSAITTGGSANGGTTNSTATEVWDGAPVTAKTVTTS